MKERSMNLRQVPVSMKRVLFAFLFFSAWAAPNASADQISGKEITLNEQSLQDKGIAISGVVSDEKGEPLIGVSVQVEGTTVGTATDFDGKFSLSVPNNNSVLVFSYMGYTSIKKTVGASKVVDVVMKEDSKILGEVVVTALGMKREQKSLGYSVTELKGDELNKNSVNPISSLQGKVAGVDIAGNDGGLFGGTKINIRGVSTLTGSNQPIYVVDGVILDNPTSETGSADWDSDGKDYGNALKNLNPDDFATISVLKGAPATALYGSRGLNGAVVITTKSGAGQQGFGVSFTQTLGIDVVTKTPTQQHLYGPGAVAGAIDYGAQYTDANGNKNYYKWDTNQFAYNNETDKVLSLYNNPSPRFWGPRFDGQKAYLYDQSEGTYRAYKNNYKDSFRTGFNTNTNVAVRGGNETTSFYTSASYKYAEGTQDRNSFSRMAFLLKGTHKVSKTVDVGGNVSFSQSKPKNPVINTGEMYAATFGPAYNTKYYQKKYQGNNQTGLASTTYGDKYGKIPGKDVWWRIYENSNEQKETMIRPSVDVSVKIQDWVTFKAEANMNFYELNREIKNLGTGQNNSGTDDGAGGKYERYTEDDNQQTYAGTFTFNKPLNDFNIGGFLRGEVYNRNQSFTQAKTDGGLILPGQYFIQNSRKQAKADTKKTFDKQMVSAVFAANVSWKDQVFVDVTGRNDWSSSLVDRYGVGNYSFFYPSVTASWLVTQTFRESLPEWISFGKVRASWAQVGNDMTPYLINMGYRLGALLQEDGSYIYTNYIDDGEKGDDTNGKRVLVSPNLKPERKNAWEVGLDWRFLDNRIGIDATFYKENTKDQIMDVDIADISGYKQLKVNAGNIQNKGIEIALKTVPFRNDDWEWTLDFTYTKNKSKIVSLDSRVPNYIKLDGDPDYGNFRVGSVAKVGGEYGMLMSDATPKLNDAGEILLTWDQTYRAAQQIRSGKVEEIGSMMPKFLGSVSTGLRYKDFTLNVGLDMRYGGYIASYTNKYSTAYGISESSLAYRDPAHGGATWTSEFADSKGQTFSDGYIPDGRFQKGTIVTTPAGIQQDVSDLTFKEAMEKGYVEPVHASAWTALNNGWGAGLVNDVWVHEVKYIALREISLSYRVPKSFSSKLGARGMNLNVTGRNLGYLYNSLPNDINPESIRGNGAANFRERNYVPYTASFMFTLGLDF